MIHVPWLASLVWVQSLLRSISLLIFIACLLISACLSITVILLSWKHRDNPLARAAWWQGIIEVVVSSLAFGLVSVLPAVQADLWGTACLLLLLERVIFFLWFQVVAGNPSQTIRHLERIRREFIYELIFVAIVAIASVLLAVISAFIR